MFNGLDFAIVGILALFSYFLGFRKGLIGVIWLLCIGVLSFLVASMASKYAGALIVERVNIPYIWARGLCFLLLLMITYVSLRLLSILGRRPAGIFNRLGGAAGAALLGVVLVGLGAACLLRVAEIEEDLTKGQKRIKELERELNLLTTKKNLAGQREELQSFFRREETDRQSSPPLSRPDKKRPGDINETISFSSDTHKVNPVLVKALIGTESNFHSPCIFSRRAKGLVREVRKAVAAAPREALPLPSRKIGGEVRVVAQPFFSLELDREVVIGLQPALSIYRRDELVKKLAIRGIRHVALIARVARGESLQGIRENDQVNLSLSPGVREMFSSPLEGEVLDVIRPGFLNINLSKEGLGDVEPTLSVYRDGELFRKIELKDIDHLSITVEAIASIKGIRKRDIVRLTP